MVTVAIVHKFDQQIVGSVTKNVNLKLIITLVMYQVLLNLKDVAPVNVSIGNFPMEHQDYQKLLVQIYLHEPKYLSVVVDVHQLLI